MWFNGRGLPLQKLWSEFLWTTGCRKWIKPWHLDGKVIPSCSSLPLLFWRLALSYLHHRILTLAVLLSSRYLDSCCPPFVTVSQLCRYPACVAGSWLISILAAPHILGSLCVLRAPQDLVTLLSCPTCDWILVHFLSYMHDKFLVHFCPIWATDLGSLCFCPAGVPGP